MHQGKRMGRRGIALALVLALLATGVMPPSAAAAAKPFDRSSLAWMGSTDPVLGLSELLGAQSPAPDTQPFINPAFPVLPNVPQPDGSPAAEIPPTPAPVNPNQPPEYAPLDPVDYVDPATGSASSSRISQAVHALQSG